MNLITQINTHRLEIDASTDRELPDTMKAMSQERYGDAEVLNMRTIAVPQYGENQVLIEVDAAGVDRGVWHLMTGQPYLIRLLGFGFLRPKQRVPGLDVSGRVTAVGTGVTDFKIGDSVFGIGSGTFAKYAVADAKKLAHRPTGVSSEQAAAVSVSGVTALEAVRDVGRVRAGQQVLVIGASGGVGTFAVQLARLAGAHVTGVASAAKLGLVRSLGAEHAIDYTQEDALDGVKRYDLILDIGGRNSLARLRRGLNPTGTLIIIGGEGGDRFTGGIGRQLRAMLLSPFVRQRLTMLVSGERGDDVKYLGELLDNGDIVSSIERMYRLDQVPDAMRDLASGDVRGKAIVKISER